MRKTKTAVILLVLAFVLAMPMAVAAANPFGEVPHRVEEGVTYVPLRLTAYSLGIGVDWDDENRIIIFISPEGVEELMPLELVVALGGFIEDGTSWLPLEMALVVFAPSMPEQPLAHLAEPARTDLWEAENFADVREAAFSTDLSHGQIALGFIEFINDNLYNRSPFTYREKETARWLVEELLAMGHDFDYIEVQEFSFGEVAEFSVLPWDLMATPPIVGGGIMRENQLSQNVILTIPGQSERMIIVGAHYDTPHYNAFDYPGYDYPGASDNASGVALLLESAQRMLEQDNYYTIVYVFFGAEEVGLLGAYFFYESLADHQRDNIVMMVNADVLIEGPNFIYGTGQIATEVTEEQIEEMIFILAEIYALIFGLDMEDALIIAAMEIADVPTEMLPMAAAQFGLLGIEANQISELVDAIALDVQYLHDIDLLAVPGAVLIPSDSLVFAFSGHTIVSLVGLSRIEDVDQIHMMVFFDYFTPSVLHTPFDDFHFIEYNWSGMIYDAMRTFSIFLEGILLARF